MLLMHFIEASKAASRAAPLLYSVDSGIEQLIALTVATSTQAKRGLKAIQGASSNNIIKRPSTIPSVTARQMVAAILLQHVKRLGAEIDKLSEQASQAKEDLFFIYDNLKGTAKICDNSVGKGAKELATNQTPWSRFYEPYKDQIRGLDKRLQDIEFIINRASRNQDATKLLIIELNPVSNQLLDYRDELQANYPWMAPIEVFIEVLDTSIKSFKKSIVGLVR
jgi:hypothetical protein